MMRLDRLFRPRSVAVIGGGTWCANVVEQCRKIGFAGDIWPVHPKRDSVGGVSAVPRIEDLPAAPDAAFVGINRSGTVEAVAALSAMDAGGAVCFASGFREAETLTGDGRALQDTLLDAAGEMPILGPNCYGFLNYLDAVALWPDQHGGKRVERGVAIIAQSSNIAINLTMQDRGLPVAYVVTIGNQAQTGLSDVARALLRDDRVTALGLYVEGFGDLRGLEALAQEARAKGVPIVALKVGKSGQAQAATVSHTASLAGSDAGAGALLKRLGIGRVSSLGGLLETLKLLHVAGPLTSNLIASMSCSGGEASLVADAAHGGDLSFPPLDADQETTLRQALGPSVALANPLDYHTGIWGNVEAMTATFTAMMRDDIALGCVVLDFPRPDRCDPSAWDPAVEAAVRARTASGRPMAILSTLNDTVPEAVADRLVGLGLVPFAGLSEGVEAMEVAAGIGRQVAVEVPLLLAPEGREGEVLPEAEAKAAFAAYGLAIPKANRASSPMEAAEKAAQIGFPVVLKGEGIAHKTEAGAVILNLPSEQAVADAASAMSCTSFLIEKMVTGTIAELLIGVVADPAHGYVLTLGAGGQLTELLEDSVSLLVPASREAVREALASLRAYRLLAGYRGQKGADIEAVLDAVMAVQAYVADTLPQEIEINPLICGAESAVAADALIRIGARK